MGITLLVFVLLQAASPAPQAPAAPASQPAAPQPQAPPTIFPGSLGQAS